VIELLRPAALAGLLAIAGPILLHLLRRQRADRVSFPSLRFLRASRTSAVRLRLPSDGWLLALRVAIIAAAVLALSQPLFVPAGRRHAWNGRLARAIVIDTSRGMGAWRLQAIEAADAEERGVFHSVRIEDSTISNGLLRASAALAAAPAARREIVVISDFSRDALTASSVAAVPMPFGLRMVPVGRPRASTEFTGATLFGARGVRGATQVIRLTPEGTLLSLRSSSGSDQGLRIVAAPRDAQAVDALLRSVARAGAPAPSAGEPIVVVFPGAEAPARTAAVGSGWMLRTVLRMIDDAELARAVAESNGAGTATLAGATPVVRNRSGEPVVIAAATGGQLVLGVAVPPSTFGAAAVVRSVLNARAGPSRWPEHEIAPMSPERLASWSRPPGEVHQPTQIQMAPGDARWLWLSALVLLGIEGLVRRRTTDANEPEAHADAA
jgi:hypothetical protein